MMHSDAMNSCLNNCRNPIPDYYSITLEISRDRTTAAEQVICDSKDLRKPPCPPWYKDGDTFLHRTLNDACQKMVGNTNLPPCFFQLLFVTQ